MRRLLCFIAWFSCLFLGGLGAGVQVLDPALADFTFSIPTTGASPVWDLTLDSVLMDVHNTENYALYGTRADAQWEALIPASGGLVQFPPSGEQFMLSMFHQLRCLDIIRRDYVAGSMGKTNGTSPTTRHCLNYIRQMVLCRGDRRLECVVDPFGEHAVQIRGAQTCRDWMKVYKSVEKMATV